MEKNVTITSKQENLRIVENLIDEISGLAKLKSEVYGKVLIAAIEAVNNAINHGNKLIAEKKVEIKISVEEKKIHIFVADEGGGFDYENVPDPTAPENIENIHGRGVFLMIQLSDEVHFFDNGSKVELIFYI
jgi:serine/threonine-protein kinase RsbW